jgi:3-hydroxyacyl-[acyl-carrier-protein] dehydratase
MNLSQISSVLDHVYPMLLIDGVSHIEPNLSCRAFKNITYNEWFFPAHFPKNPIVPGSLQIEIFTQVVAIPLVVSKNLKNCLNKKVLLAGVDKVRFYKPLVPGDRFEIFTQIDRIAMDIASASVKGSVNGEIISECKITYKIVSQKESV